jgi:uncharacterized protein (TIGR04255 family)
LEPVFETFGPKGSAIAPTFRFGLVTGATHDRFWFLSEDETELLQFQHDRFHHNWRKVPSLDNPYPRFEKMIERFQEELLQLNTYFSKNFDQSLVINQCEISYVNHISTEGHDRPWEDIFSFLRFSGEKPEDIGCKFRHEMLSGEDQPIGRLTVEAANGVSQTGSPIVVFTLTARGAPEQPTTEAALRFLSFGRLMIVRMFTELTTDSAHKRWERVQ